MTTFDATREASKLSDALHTFAHRLECRGDAAGEFAGSAWRLWRQAARLADSLNNLGPVEPPDGEDGPICDPIAEQRMDAANFGH